MSSDAEKIKGLLAFKKKLEAKIEALESELKELRATLETVNSVLLEKGFKRAEVITPPQGEVTETAPLHPQALKEPETVVPLKTADGELLANIIVGENSLKVVPAEDKNFNINTPPFNQFLLEKVFVKMQEKDTELARGGQLSPEKIFSYSIVRDGDIIREIIVNNVDAERLKELKSSIRWTFEKMYEKMKS
ncbi:MAG: hypothetical protein C0193_01090 [Candidatus Bathyarchaeota archaeon]|nr:MAG: hypothetical protein C0193_01090 [Candidatus Bathyarchaeota archaeon]